MSSQTKQTYFKEQPNKNRINNHNNNNNSNKNNTSTAVFSTSSSHHRKNENKKQQTLKQINEYNQHEQNKDANSNDEQKKEKNNTYLLSLSTSSSLSLALPDNKSNSIKEYANSNDSNNNNNNKKQHNQQITIRDQSTERILADAGATILTIPTINANNNKIEISKEFASKKSSLKDHSLYANQTIDETITKNIPNINEKANINSNSEFNFNNKSNKLNDQQIVNNLFKNMGQKLIKSNEMNMNSKVNRNSNVETVKMANKCKKLTLTSSVKACLSPDSMFIATATDAAEKDNYQDLEKFFDSSDNCEGDKTYNKCHLNDMQVGNSIKKKSIEILENDNDDEDIEYTDEFADIVMIGQNNVEHLLTPSNNFDIECSTKSFNSQALNNSAMNLQSDKTHSDSGLGDSADDFPSSSQSSLFDNNKCSKSIKQMQQEQQQQQQQQQQHQHHLHFVRDSKSIDCEETLCNEEALFDYTDALKVATTNTDNERLVCLESISLPDVVMESTNSAAITSANATSASGSVDAVQSHHPFIYSPSMENECDIVNINGEATSNVHFIPISVEGQCKLSQPKSNDNCVEIIEDGTEIQASDIRSLLADQLTKDLAEQKNYFRKQSEDAQENVQNLQNKIYQMQKSLDNLEQELSAKTWNVERLQSELNAAQRDDEYVRKKLKLLENEKDLLRHRYNQWEDEFRRKYESGELWKSINGLEAQYQEMEEKYKETQKRANNLHEKLNEALNEVEKWRTQAIEIRNNLEEQVKLLKNAAENSENERKICADKWQREFEMLRTHNMEREESIMRDCEWQLRQIQKQSKEKIDKLDHEQRAAKKKIDELKAELEERCHEIDDIRTYQSQVNSLRGVVNEQENSIKFLIAQIDTLKSELATTKDQLEEQLEAVEKIKVKCEQTLCDKERHMHYRSEEIRNEAATFWENKLYNELTRLKSELDSVYVEERRDALHKLQLEHVEELRAITNRYTANEEELRAELVKVQERLEKKTEEFLKLREKSDNAILQMRAHLERADRDYQVAMYREEEKRDMLEKTLRNEFNKEREALEVNFEERLHQVEVDFANKLKLSTNDLNAKHTKILENIKQKYNREKEDALKALAEKHHQKLSELEESRKELMDNHKRDLSELKSVYQAEKAALDKRDISNAQEIEQLHRKCRCLTNLFEEMRMRYERRDPRPEDLREISELRTRCEAQERDLYLLTDRLRKMQIQMDEVQQNYTSNNNISSHNKKMKQYKKLPVKSVPISCDVIYEESEEMDSTPSSSHGSIAAAL